MRASRACAVLALTLLLSACATGASASPSPAAAAPSPPAVRVPAATTSPASAPHCLAPVAPTAAQTEGPFFKAGSPERASLVESGMPGTRLVLSGYVLTRSCAAVAGALLDFWHADAGGQYDNTGYRLRGHLSTDAQGRYRLETIVPGLYTGRTRHIHVKVQAPGGSVLTTQIYFPGEAGNASDSIFRSQLLAKVDQSVSVWSARFDFILDRP